MRTEPRLEGVILLAGDDGPRAALTPLKSAGAHWSDAATAARALVVGTSQSDAGIAIEAAARRQAARAGIPVACIEDFPGNYREIDGIATSLLVVEGEFSVRLYRQRLRAVPPMAVVPPARYDAQRQGAMTPTRGEPPYLVLWAGQPETESCIATLARMAEFLREPDIRFLFRAHPRDRGYAGGAYRDFLARLGTRARDVSSVPLVAVLKAPLQLVLTQYSSVAVEAGFAGIPSAYVLLPGAGEDLLFAQKGYRVPMPCDAGAAFHARNPDLRKMLDTALRDSGARAAVLARFRALYRAETPQTPHLVEHVAGIID